MVDIDHIIPLNIATCEDDVIKFNHYTNLQHYVVEQIEILRWVIFNPILP